MGEVDVVGVGGTDDVGVAELSSAGVTSSWATSLLERSSTLPLVPVLLMSPFSAGEGSPASFFSPGVYDCRLDAPTHTGNQSLDQQTNPPSQLASESLNQSHSHSVS